MLFLINDQVFDISDPTATAGKHGHLITPTPIAHLRPADVVEIGKEVFFQAEGDRPRVEILVALSSMLADRTDANAALFVRPPQAQSRADVLVRFVDAPITTLAYLHKMQIENVAPVALVNKAVWSHAA